MIRTLLVASFAVACGAAPPPAPAPSAPPPATMPHLVVVSVDGLMADAYVHPDAHGLKIPALRQLIARGAYATGVEGVFPTVTYPSHTTMATGVPPAVHGIVGNKPVDPLGKNAEGWWWYSEDIHAPTLWDAVEAQHRRAGLVSWPVTVGARVSFNVPEYWRAGTADDQKLLRALATPGLLDRVAREDHELWQQLRPPMAADASIFAIATYLVTHEHPDLLMIHAPALDEAEHEHGPWSPEAIAAIENVDALIGQLAATISAQPEAARTTLVIVSDHGFAPIDHELEPYVVLARHHLITLDGTKTVAARVGVVTAGGTALFYLIDPSAAAELDAAVAELPDVRRLSREQLAAFGADPAAAFALVAPPGFAFGGERTGELVVAKPGHGTHGWPPTDPAMAASFIAVGPGIAHRELGRIRMLDIAPSLAAWVGVALPAAIGSAIR
ncbi:MAG TPA: ectonucleotide pyrophosphatase/phosphodiesterase [Kofleriaceae bacterium]|nr:ectonucleotide pyrophosphatase/phosphodiesterase [Kofleriaceae bacterium]